MNNQANSKIFFKPFKERKQVYDSFMDSSASLLPPSPD